MKKIFGLLPALSLMVWSGGLFDTQEELNTALARGGVSDQAQMHLIAPSVGAFYEWLPSPDESSKCNTFGSMVVVDRHWGALAAHEVMRADLKNSFITLLPNIEAHWWALMKYIGRSPYEDDLSDILPLTRRIESVVYPKSDGDEALAFVKFSEPVGAEHVPSILGKEGFKKLYASLDARCEVPIWRAGYGHSLVKSEVCSPKKNRLRSFYDENHQITQSGMDLLRTHSKSPEKRTVSPSVLTDCPFNHSRLSCQTPIDRLRVTPGLPGDSGGGAFIKEKDTYKLLGITTGSSFFGDPLYSLTTFRPIEPFVSEVLRQYD